MQKLFAFLLSCLILFATLGAQPASAADFRAGEDITIPQGTPNLSDLYLFGSSIQVDAPVNNDLVAAGGDLTINQPVSGSVIIAGGDINLNGAIGNTLRVAGGNIQINAPISRDLVVSGGSITVTKNASVGGDVLFGGGQLKLNAPVQGKAQIAGGEVVINSTINGDVNATVEQLTLGPEARINGNLTYKSDKKAEIAQGAVVSGQTKHTPIEKQQQKDVAKGFVTAGAIYKLIVDILVSILLIFFFARGISAVLGRMTTKPIESGAIGFAFIFLFPILALLCFVLIWLGLGALLTYALIFLVSLFVVKIFLGWFVLRWWQGRKKKHYQLDWKAGVIGPVLLFVIAAIPFIGWIAGILIMFVATGALIYELVLVIKNQKSVPQKSVAKKK